MPPNLLFKEVFEQKELDCFQKRHHTKDDFIRIDFILENAFSYLLEGYYNFNAMTAINEKENDVLESMKEFLCIFKDKYRNGVRHICSKINLRKTNYIHTHTVLLAASNKLFSKGITWSSIVTFLVFIGELTIMHKNVSKDVADEIYRCFYRLIKRKLES